MKTLKNSKKYAIKLDRKCKNAKLRYYQQIYYKLKNRGDYSILVNYQSFLSNFFSIAPPPPPPITFLYKLYTKWITPCEFYWTIRFYNLPASKQEN